jgi:hypothetical protein
MAHPSDERKSHYLDISLFLTLRGLFGGFIPNALALLKRIAEQTFLLLAKTTEAVVEHISLKVFP